MRKLVTLSTIILLTACGAQEPEAQTGGTQAASGTANAATENAEASVLDVINSFNAAIAAGDTAAVLATLHPDLVVYESGYVEDGRDVFEAEHLPADIEVMQQSTMTGETPRVTVSESGDMAWAISTYHLEGQYRDRALDLQGAATMVLVRTDQGWQIRHIHYSSHPTPASS